MEDTQKIKISREYKKDTRNTSRFLGQRLPLSEQVCTELFEVGGVAILAHEKRES